MTPDYDARFWLGYYRWSIMTPEQRMIQRVYVMTARLTEVIFDFGMTTREALTKFSKFSDAQRDTKNDPPG